MTKNPLAVLLKFVFIRRQPFPGVCKLRLPGCQSFILHGQKLSMDKIDKIIIRKASLKDLDILLRFEQGVINAERPSDSTLKDGLIHYYDIEEMITASHIELLVAELDGHVIGSGYARIENSKPYLKHKRHAYLGFMYVDPDYRGRGVNRKIIERLKQWSISQDITEMRLDVYYNNLTAIKAYVGAGFTKHMVEMRMGLHKD